MEELKAKGNAHFTKGEYDEAIAAYSQAIQLDATAVLYANRSAAYLGVNNAKSALEDADKAILIDPTYAKGYLRKSKALRALGIPAHAEKVLQDAREQYKNNGILVQALEDFYTLEDGDQSPLHGIFPGTPAQKMRDFQSNEGMMMHTTPFLEMLPSAWRYAFLGDLDKFKETFNPEKDSNQRAWKVKLPLTSVIVSGAQRISLVDGQQNSVQNYPGIMDYILENGWCRPDAKDIAGYTALSHAAGHHSVPELVKVLLKHGANPNIRNRFGATSLLMSVTGQSVEAAQMLLDADADPRIPDNDGSTPEKLAMMAPSILAMMHKKMNKHQENKDVVPGARCHNPQCQKPGATRRCSGCSMALYCSRDCQRNHWKVHKKHCGKASASTANTATTSGGDGGSSSAPAEGSSSEGKVTVNVHSHRGLQSMVIPMSIINDNLMKATGMKDGAPLTPEEIKQQSFRMEAERAEYAKKKSMVVKVQVPLFVPPGYANEMMIYNKSRSFQAMTSGDAPEGIRLADVVKTRGINGNKAYFLAYTEKEGTLTVLIDKMLPTQPW